MFKDVQKKLTVLYTTLTGLILMVLLACIFMWNITAREHGESAAFQNLWLSVSSHLQMDSALSHSYLAQTEAANRAVIHVEENGSPLLYSGSWNPPTGRARLIELGLRAAAAEHIDASRPPVSSSMEQSSVFRIKGDNGDSYYGQMCVLASEKGSGSQAFRGSKSLLLLTYITPRSALLLKSLPMFLALSAAGILGILFVSWHLTGRALRPARESAKQQVEFIAAASHELRSPLAVIRAAVSALQGGQTLSAGDSGTETSALLTTVDKECSRMARLVGDMLLLASSDAGTWSLQKQTVEPDTLLIETYESFLPLCRDKHIKLSLALPEEPLPSIRADLQRVEQVLSILLDNALSYSPGGGEITLSARPGGDGALIIEVCDRGKGIPDELKAHIFDRFYRGDASRSDKKHFGLGLSIAKELVELHGGTITVLDNPGGGSRFVVRL